MVLRMFCLVLFWVKTYQICFVVQQLLSMFGWAKSKSNYFQLVNLITN